MLSPQQIMRNEFERMHTAENGEDDQCFCNQIYVRVEGLNSPFLLSPLSPLCPFKKKKIVIIIY